MKLLFRYLCHIVSGSVLRRNVVYTLGRQLTAAVAQFLVVVIIARELGPEGNGQYAMAILLPNLLVSFLNLGVGPANVFYLGRGEVSSHHATVENIKIAGIITFLGTIVALLIIGKWGEILFPGIPDGILYIGVLAFPVALLIKFFSTILQGIEDFKGFNWAVLSPALTGLLYVSIGIYLLELGLIGAVTGFLLGQISGLFIVCIFLRRQLKKGSSREISIIPKYKRRSLAYGFKAHLSNILTFINYRADIFLVNLILGPVATGIYVISVKIAEQLWMLSQAASMVLLPRLSAMHEDPGARLKLTHKAFVGIVGLTVIGGLVLAISLYWLLVPIFGEEFSGAFIPFLWLLPGILAGAGARVQANCIAAAGKPEWNMYLSIVVVMINISFNIILIPRYGIAGAAIATTIAYITSALIIAVLVRKTGALPNFAINS